MGALRNARTAWALVQTLADWPTYFADGLGLTGGPRATYRLRNGLSLTVRPRTLDTAVLKDVFVRRVYARPGFEVRAGDLVVDIGAHIGLFAAAAARSAPRVRLVAVEPYPENFSLLTANLARNGLDNVHPVRAAVAASTGERSLHVSSNPAGHSLHLAEAGQPTIGVATTTLEDLLRAHAPSTVDLLKIDCEGAEFEILERAAPETLSRVRRIVMEAHTIDAGRTPSRIVRVLEEQGYRVAATHGRGGTSLIWATREPA
jgi:FkbM family methyltransferase